MCYVCVMHENITQKNSFEMKFYSTLLLAEGIKMKEKRDTCLGSLSRCFVSEIYAKPDQNPFFLPVAQYFYSPHVQDWCSSNFSTIQLHFITAIAFPVSSNLERYKHNCHFSCDKYSSKLFQSGNTCQRIKKYPARN